MLGTVMVDDQLFAGTIAENISSSMHAEQERTIGASAAAIHHDRGNAMGYGTFVGDFGSALRRSTQRAARPGTIEPRTRAR
jgi:ABC-type protease/lipase transport system fused ATPase/permease subunit